MRPWKIALIVIVTLALISGAALAGLGVAPADIPDYLSQLGHGGSKVEARGDTPAPVTVPVERGDVQQTIIGPGQLVNVGEQAVGFRASGTLIKVSVLPGEPVRKGDMLASLDDRPLRRAVEQARQALAIAEDNLAQAREPFTPVDILQAQAAVELSKAALSEAEAALLEEKTRDHDADVADAHLAVQQAEAQVVRARRELAQVRDDPTEAELAVARAAVESAEQTYQELLTQPEPEDVKQADLTLAQTRNSLWGTQANRDSVCGAAAQGLASSAACDAAKAQVANAEVAVQLAELAREGALEPATAADLASAGARLELAKQELSLLVNGADPSVVAQAEASCAASEQQLLRAQRELTQIVAQDRDLEVAQAQARVSSARYELAESESWLAEILAGPDPQEIRRAEAAYLDAQAALEDAEAALDGSRLLAPSDGTVVAVSAQIGALVSPGMPVVSLADPSALEVRATIIEEDLPLIQLGQEAELFFDAIPDMGRPGQVSRIVPVRIPGSDRPLYEVFITVGDLPSGLAAGMTADASIVVAKRPDVLRLPRGLVRARADGTATVELWADGTRQSREIQTGLRGDIYIEIVAGLSEGEQVVGR